MKVVAAASDGQEAVLLTRQLHPNVILMDLVIPHKDGLSATVEILQVDPTAHILVLTSFADDERVFPAIKAGALGYLLKDTPATNCCRPFAMWPKGALFLTRGLP
jgi:NarL family two-component system response regulator LiaR